MADEKSKSKGGGKQDKDEPRSTKGKVHLAEDPGKKVDVKRIIYTLLGVALFCVVNWSPPWPDAVDPDGVQFALSPNRQRLVATTQLTGKLLVFDATLPELPLLTEVDVGTQPWHPTFLPDGSRVFFGAKDDDAVIVVETEGWTVVDRITGPGIVEPHGSAVTADGR